MPSLLELQRGFCDAVYRGGPARSLGICSRGAYSAEQRVGLYRSSVVGILTGALAAVYPVVQRLVGEAFFERMARAYIPEHPSRSGDLHQYGESFAAFIDTFEPVAELVYLADVARLEWSYHQVFHAAAHPPLALADLARVPASQHPGLRFDLHPAAALLRSPFPVHRIWEVNLPGRALTTVRLDEGEAHLLVVRPDLVVEVVSLAPGDFAFLQALGQGASLQTACELAVETDQRFEAGLALARYLQSGTVVGFRSRSSSEAS